MQLLSEIKISKAGIEACIQLLQGDCTAIPKEHNADILVVSAFPNDYTPLPGSLMFALREKGVDVGAMAMDKSVDLVAQLGCWMSKPLSAERQQQFNFKQILCFEPSRQSGAPEAVVGNIFRCINNFAFDDDYNVVVMPLLATGKQRVPMETMLPAMLDACIFWLEQGIPLDAIKLVVKNDEQAQKALPLFEQEKKEYEDRRAGAGSKKAVANPVRGMAPVVNNVSPPVIGAVSDAAAGYDFFISYSHVQTEQVAELVAALKARDAGYRIFYDRSSIPPGGQWIRQISDAIQRSKNVICVLSPQYRDSPVCWDEFQCAKAREYRTKQSIIKTINFLQDPDMPLIMSLYSYIDCTEGNMQKLRDSAQQLC